VAARPGVAHEMGTGPGRDGLTSVREALDAAPGPRTYFFRDDDAGWASDRLFALLDLFARHAVPIDVAVIPAALDRDLATRLRRRPEAANGLLSFHQHGYAHANHEPSGRRCEFGPSRLFDDQRRDIAAGARRLRRLLGQTPPIFTPPWNRCTETTGRCLVDLGFTTLARDSTSRPLELDGLQEVHVHVDWARPLAADSLAGCGQEPTGIMLHHALLDADERRRLERLLALLASHENARCVSIARVATESEPASRGA
jgi:peptidoglycan/xylan/chitin deacetylase (PgdA/CDA1 family)